MKTPLVILLMLLAVMLTSAEEPAKKDAPVSGKIDGKEFRFVKAVVLPFSSDPEVIDVGIFQEDVKADMPFSELPALMLRIPKAGGEAEFRGKVGATFYLPPSKSVSAQSGKISAEKKADGTYVCHVIAAAGEKHRLEGSFTVTVPTK